jgi:hypothetical protein
LHAETERTFFVMEADLRFRFEVDAQGKITGVVVTFGGADTRAVRVAR